MRNKCIICGKKIFRARNPTTKRLRRGWNAMTCKKECSRVYVNNGKRIKKEMGKDLNNDNKIWKDMKGGKTDDK